MQLVAAIWEIEPADESSVLGRRGVGVDDAERVFLSILPVGEQRDIRQGLRWRLAGHPGRWIECGIGEHACHGRVLGIGGEDRMPIESARCLEMLWRTAGALMEISGRPWPV